MTARARRFTSKPARSASKAFVSKRLDAPYAPGDRHPWLKTKCLNHEEFAVAGRMDPEGSSSFIGALLLRYYNQTGGLIYAGRVGTGCERNQLADLLRPPTIACRTLYRSDVAALDPLLARR